MQLILRTLSVFLMLILLSSPVSAAQKTVKSDFGLIDGLAQTYPAPLIMGITAWVNSQPIKLSDLKGKVVLIEFWSTTCPFCSRAIPYVNAWYDTYKDYGLVIIGVHSPKTEEEQSLDRVKEAITDFKIRFPVALDNYFETWDNYNAGYWPAFFLIDKKGDVVYASFGAKDYDIIENNIRFLLGDKTPKGAE